jgi:SAM-dependent methyltransferase
MKKLQRSIHISYDLDDHDRKGKAIRQSIISLVESAAEKMGVMMCDLRILDAGCGIGLLMRDLKNSGVDSVTGIDFDDECLALAAKYGSVHKRDLTNLKQNISENSFDVVILSHVLEHLANPIEFLKQIKFISSRWIVVACPNPVRPKVLIKYGLRARNYSNQGHVYSWDRSHLSTFLERYNHLRISDWATDDIKIVPFRSIRRLIKGLGLLDRLEMRVLPRYLPYFSSSIIALCEILEEGTTYSCNT